MRLFPSPPHSNFSLEKLISSYHNVMKFCLVNKLTIENKFIFHISHRNITHSVIITRKTTEKKIKLEMWGEIGKEPIMT